MRSSFDCNNKPEQGGGMLADVLNDPAVFLIRFPLTSGSLTSELHWWGWRGVVLRPVEGFVMGTLRLRSGWKKARRWEPIGDKREDAGELRGGE